MKQIRPRLTEEEYKAFLEYKNSTPLKVEKSDDDERRVLVIGDLHEPFTRFEYLDFCKGIEKKYNCNRIIFIGDILDNHVASYHESNPDGMGGAEELRKAKERIKQWYEAFPVAKVVVGNHDQLPDRKAFTSGLSASWIRSISEVLDTPNWEYSEQYIIDKVMYVHGTGRKAGNRMQKDLISVVQGHYHSESYITFAVGAYKRLFAMQIGTGADDKSYAMAYGRHFDKMHINCGVVLENGTLPILEYANLGNW